jgi:hypothetical protein
MNIGAFPVLGRFDRWYGDRRSIGRKPTFKRLGGVVTPPRISGAFFGAPNGGVTDATAKRAVATVDPAVIPALRGDRGRRVPERRVGLLALREHPPQHRDRVVDVVDDADLVLGVVVAM